MERERRSPVQRCRFIDKCPMFPRFSPPNGLQHFKEIYCHTAEHTKCARYKLASQGKMPETNLLPNGYYQD